MQWSPDFLNLLGKLTKTGLQNREARAIGGKIFTSNRLRKRLLIQEL